MGLSCLAVAGLFVFIIYFMKAFQTGKHYTYSCPLSAMWAGLGVMWYAVLFLVWWYSSTKNNRLALKVWAAIGILFAIEGFVSIIGWALSENEGAAAVFSS